MYDHCTTGIQFNMIVFDQKRQLYGYKYVV